MPEGTDTVPDGCAPAPGAPASNARRRRRAQDGFGLIEVMISVALVASIVVALAAGLLFLVRTTSSTRELQQMHTVLGNFAESVKHVDYLSCRSFGVGEQPGEPDPSGAATIDAGVARAHYVGAMAVLDPSDPASTQLGRTIEQAGPDGSGNMQYRPTSQWRVLDGITVELVSVEFWEKVVPPSVAPPAEGETRPGAFQPSCPFERDRNGALILDAGSPIVIDDGSQLLTLRVRHGDRSVTTQVVKTDRSLAPEAGP